MISFEALLPEELDVLARAGARDLDVSAMFVVQDVFRAAAGGSALTAGGRRTAGRGPDLVRLHDALLPVGLGAARDA